MGPCSNALPRENLNPGAVLPPPPKLFSRNELFRHRIGRVLRRSFFPAQSDGARGTRPSLRQKSNRRASSYISIDLVQRQRSLNSGHLRVTLAGHRSIFFSAPPRRCSGFFLRACTLWVFRADDAKQNLNIRIRRYAFPAITFRNNIIINRGAVRVGRGGRVDAADGGQRGSRTRRSVPRRKSGPRVPNFATRERWAGKKAPLPRSIKNVHYFRFEPRAPRMRTLRTPGARTARRWYPLRTRSTVKAST